MTRSRDCRLFALGMTNSLGATCDEIWPRARAGDQSHLTRTDQWVPDVDLLVGAVTTPLPEIPAHLKRHACRNNALTLAALQQILPDVKAAVAAWGPSRIGVVMGTSTAGAIEMERTIKHRLEANALPDDVYYDQLEFGGTAGFVAETLGVCGPAYTLSTACSSGARALASARSLLSLGLCDAVVAGATDTLCGLTTNGFSALHAVAAGLSNPCSVNRDGLTLGEGSAMFLVTREPGGIQLRGAGESSEAHHMSAPDPTGDGAERAMRSALTDAGLQPESIAYLNLHGTGTPHNDVMECKAVSRIFGENVPCSSTKPLVGHTLGAAGAIEAGFGWLILQHRASDSLPLLPHCYDGEWDPEIPRVALVGAGESAPVAADAFVMSNSFGFGGNNCTLILEGPKA